MTAVIHRGDGNGRSPFQVSVGVVRLRRWWLVTQEDNSLFLPLCYWLKFQADCLRRVPFQSFGMNPPFP